MKFKYIFQLNWANLATDFSKFSNALPFLMKESFKVVQGDRFHHNMGTKTFQNQLAKSLLGSQEQATNSNEQKKRDHV